MDKGRSFFAGQGPAIFENTVVKKPTKQALTNENEGSRERVGEERAAGRRVELVVEVARAAEEKAYCRGLLEAEHGLGVGHPAGRQLMQRVKRREDGAVVAVLIWAASAWHLKDRDEWIGWDGMTRSRRLGLIVNNSRLLIVEAHREANLATQVMGAALRVLVAQWREEHGYEPLLAEAFTDLETHHGTSYKASNWIALGHTKGFGRHRADFYIAHDRPKKLWVYPLHQEARTLLCARELATAQAGGEIAALVRSPLRVGQMHSLMDVFRELDDPRRISSRRYPLSLMLCLISMGLLCGAQNLSDIVRSVQLLGQRERRALGLPRKKNTCVYRVPCYNAFRDLLPMLDLEQFITLLNTWLGQHEGILPRTLALDGKDLGGQMGTIISLINTTRHASAVTPEDEQDHAHTPPIAMACAPGKGHEMTAARTLLQRPEINLCGAVLTADALHAQKETLHTIVTKGGDYLVSLRDNQPKAAAFAQTQLAETPPLFQKPPRPTVD